MDRRQFLEVAATLAAGAALPTPAVAADKAVLTPQDLRYLGLFKLPGDDPTARTRFGYTLGAMAVRRVAGELRIFIAGSAVADPLGGTDPVYEIDYPGAGPLDTAPRARLIRNWGDIYGGRRRLRDTNQTPTTTGLLYESGRLWWTYGSSYFSGSDPDPSLGVAYLNDSTGAKQIYGPWRTQEHSQRTRGYMTLLPSDFATAYTGGRRLCVGTPQTSGNAAGPVGAVLYAMGNFDPRTLPADTAGATGGSVPFSVSCKRLVHHDSEHPQERNSNYKVCGWNVLYDYSKGAWLKDGEATFNNYGYRVDYFSGCTWVQTANKAGLVYVGGMVEAIPGRQYQGDTLPHLWYGPEGMACCHGQTSGFPGTGQKAASAVPKLGIYDPADVARAATGAISPWGYAPTTLTNLATLAPGAIDPLITLNYQFSSAAFDADERLLLVCELGREVLGEPRPVVHVFQVLDGSLTAPQAPTNLRINVA